MKLTENKTPLVAVPGLSSSEVLTLKACGISTWEEYCAYAHTYSGVTFAGSELFRGKIGADVFDSIANSHIKPRLMGCVIPEASLTRMMATCCETFAKPGPIDAAVGDFSEDGLPHEVRLMEQMPEIRDQGDRGTCTAFASVALCEFAEECDVRLSPQFLYWASKKRDGRPNSDGTSLDVVQETLYEDGVCEEDLWPYNRKPLFDDDGVLDAGQGPAPDEAVEDAMGHRLSCRALSPESARQYRRVLASGVPVVVGLTTFRSWTANQMTAETGKVPMPYMKRDEDGVWHLAEKPSGGHAMCLVGYVDDASWPGGGYFIVRNSWGEDWASDCEEGAGHALIPYRYVALFTHSAFTLVDGSPEGEDDRKGASAKAPPAAGARRARRPSPLDGIPPNLRPFAQILKSDARDFRGFLLKKGTCVLSLPQPGSPLVEYKPANFATAEYRAILTMSRFPAKARWTAEQTEAYDSVLRRRQEFCAKIDANLSKRSIRFKPFPEFKFSWNTIQLMGVPRIWSSSVVADFSDALLDRLLADALPPDEDGVSQIPDDWRKAIRATVSARVRKVSCISLLPRAVYVVEVFATPFEIGGASGVCQFAQPSVRFVETVRACAVDALRGKAKGRFVFYTIGTGLPMSAQVDGISEGMCSVTVSGPADDCRWDVRSPSYLTGKSAYRDFLDRLMPVTFEDLTFAVKTFVDGVPRSGISSASVDVDEIVDHLHEKGGRYADFPMFRRTAVIRSLLQMHGSSPGQYAVCTRKDRGVFVVPASEVVDGDRAYKGRCWLVSLLLSHFIHFAGLVVCSAFIIGRATFEEITGWGGSCAVRIVLMAVTMFVCGIVQGVFNRAVAVVERE